MGPCEEAEIPQDDGKTWLLACLEKERVRSNVTQKKIGVELKRRRGLSKRKLGWRLAWWGSTAKKNASHFLGLRRRHQYPDQHSNRNRAPCVASTAVRPRWRRTKWPDRQRKESS